MIDRFLGRVRLEWLYSLALRLYPARFAGAYAPAMRQSFRDALGDGAVARRELIPLVVRDLVTSLFKEYFAMFYETFGRPALVYNALVLIGLSTGLALALNKIPQQVLRQGANDPQIQMAGDLAAVLNKYGVNDGLRQSGLTNSGGVVDMDRSLAPFVIVYNDQGQPVGSNAQLNGQTPTPPAGVFDHVRQHGEERVSWQPVPGREHGVRIAAVVERVNGAQPGFVLAGRNMREVEAREQQVGQLALLTWIGMMGVILVGTGVYGWWMRPRAA
jgi:hypothetical protein